jgi:hypothetical protein
MMTEKERNSIKEILASRGLTFEPLQSEMLDHICCDVEALMEKGISFDAALEKTLAGLPAGHFDIIQRDTLEAIDHRAGIARWAGYVSVLALYGAILFKTLHLQFGDILLLFTFFAMGVSLIAGTLSGVIKYPELKGGLKVFAIIGGTLLLLIGYCFRVLHFPGGSFLITAGVIVVVTAVIWTIVSTLNNNDLVQSMLIRLHERYTSELERFFLLLVMPAAVFTVLRQFGVAGSPMLVLVLLFAVFGAGLHFIVLYLRSLDARNTQRRVLIFMMLLSFALLAAIFLGEIVPWEVRIVMIVLYTMITAWLVGRGEKEPNPLSMFVLVVVSAVFLMWGLSRLEVITPVILPYLFNVPVLLFLVALIFVSPKNSAMRTFMIISLSGYILEFR